jgi:hypothetical protein
VFDFGPIEPEYIISNITEQDTIKERQILYNGILWTNRYHRIEGHQFLFSDFFLPGKVTINGRTFKDVRIKYDIFSDEIIIPINRDDIIQINKEMVDSFSLSYENRVYRFTTNRENTLKGFTGYFHELYYGKSSFYVKYKKSISPSSDPKSDGKFIQNHQMYLVKDSIVYPITSIKALLEVLNADKDQIRDYIKKNRLKISKKIPDSFVPVISYYDSISQQ